MVEKIRSFVPKKLVDTLLSLKYKYWDGYSIKTYSQDGEDLFLLNIFHNHKNGFYVDIGAHHPIKYSNTYLLYKKGWRGINIDCMPNSMKLFKSFRKRDINLEFGVSDKESQLEYFVFEESALNGFSKELSQQRVNDGHVLKKSIKINTYPINSLLEKYLSGNRIDLLNIDIEGMDISILKALDFERYRPKVIVAETLSDSIDNLFKNEIFELLKAKNYHLKTMGLKSSIFINES